MIRNERQYRVTARQRRMLAEALDHLLADEPRLLTVDDRSIDLDDALFGPSLERASLSGQLAELDAQLREYEQLRAGELSVARVTSLADLPQALIRARIAAGLSQRELAERLGFREQQIQRYEAEEYASASIARLEAIGQVLGLELNAEVLLPTKALLPRLRRRLVKLGFNRQVVNGRLLRDLDEDAGPTKVYAAAERLARLIAVPVEQLLAPVDAPVPVFATTGRFKAPKGAAQASTEAYTRYAEGLADIVVKATSQLGEPRLPGTAQQVREAIDEMVADEGEATLSSEALFTATLRYVYGMGIPVVPLRDPGGFHGACFAREGRVAIVLKQTSDSPARWLTDLLHELDHVGDPQRKEARSWVELGDISQWSDAPEEQRANAFAAEILFYGPDRAGWALEACVNEAGGSVERLKRAIPVVAGEAGVPEDVLANYLAFQLSRRGINWWGTANTFQRRADPWRVTADALLTHLDLTVLDARERSALVDVLAG
jgi:transcriptional regulator with XRE-family HTH domain